MDEARWALRQVYYAERAYRNGKERYTDDWAELGVERGAPAGYRWPPGISATKDQFEATLAARSGKSLKITQDGRVTIVRDR